MLTQPKRLAVAAAIYNAARQDYPLRTPWPDLLASRGFMAGVTRAHYLRMADAAIEVTAEDEPVGASPYCVHGCIRAELTCLVCDQGE